MVEKCCCTQDGSMDSPFKIKYISSRFAFNLMEILIIKQIPLFFETPCILIIFTSLRDPHFSGWAYSSIISVFQSWPPPPHTHTKNKNMQYLKAWIFHSLCIFTHLTTFNPLNDAPGEGSSILEGSQVLELSSYFGHLRLLKILIFRVALIFGVVFNIKII